MDAREFVYQNLKIKNYEELSFFFHGKPINGECKSIEVKQVQKGDYGNNFNYSLTVVGTFAVADEYGVLQKKIEGDVECRIKFSNNNNGEINGIKEYKLKGDSIYFSKETIS